jgi:hypothetical protein
MRYEFAVLHLVFNLVEMLRNLFNPALIANYDYLLRQLFRMQIKVVNAPVGVKN